MSHRQRARRYVVAGLAAALLVMGWAVVAEAAVIEGLVPAEDAAKGLGWAVHPTDQEGGGTERFVEGPLTPPSGRGSLEMAAPTSAARALIFTVPKPNDGTPIGDIAANIAIPWADTTGSFSTFTTNAAEPAASIPALLLIGLQYFDADNPAASREFTAVHLEGGFQTGLSPGAAPNVWRTWTLNGQAKVWQSNTVDGFCGIDLPCTFSEFAAKYPTGAWGQIQVGMGTGLPPDTVGYVDNVQLANPNPITDTADGFAFSSDFEVPAAENSTATLAAGAATATGGTVTATLNSSALAALGSTPFSFTFSGTSATSPAPVTVPAGETSTQSFAVPFGTTQVTVQAQGVTLASIPVTFQQPTTTTIAATTAAPTTMVTTTPTASTGSSTGSTAGAQLAETGFDPRGPAGIAAALLVVGSLAVASTRRRRTDH